MKSISMADAKADIEGILNAAQKERIVLTRGGKPSAVLVGLEGYDEEDLRLAGSVEFWRMIEDRRRRGRSIPLRELKARLKGKPRPRRKAAARGVKSEGGKKS